MASLASLHTAQNLSGRSPAADVLRPYYQKQNHFFRLLSHNKKNIFCTLNLKEWIMCTYPITTIMKRIHHNQRTISWVWESTTWTLSVSCNRPLSSYSCREVYFPLAPIGVLEMNKNGTGKENIIRISDTGSTFSRHALNSPLTILLIVLHGLLFNGTPVEFGGCFNMRIIHSVLVFDFCLLRFFDIFMLLSSHLRWVQIRL